MKILVLSCDKNDDTFEAFYHCMEKYWPKHPEVIYITETIMNPYYKTLCKNYPLEKWTNRIRECIEQIDDEQILLMIDDCFIRQPVDKKRIQYASKNLKGNIAMFNFEKSWDDKDEVTALEGFKKRPHGAEYELSIMCGLWQKKALLDILEGEYNPWEVEGRQDTKGYDYYINSGEYIIDWGYETFIFTGICKGKWCRNVIPFFEKEGIKIDYERRGFCD